MTPVVAGLDIASSTGVAVGPLGGRPELFTVDLRRSGDSRAARFMEMQSLVFDLISTRKVDVIAIESPLPGGRNSTNQNRLSMGLVGIVEGWAHRQKVPCHDFTAQTIAKHFVGDGGLKRKERKAAIIAACERRGWAPDDDDQADAAALWDLMCCRLSPDYAARTAPIFAGGC